MNARSASPGTPTADAADAGLIYVSDADPGIVRRRVGKGFGYRAPDGTPVRDRATLARIRALAIPPAYTDVWICTSARGHLQATGRDARGRKQYRYHARWQAVRGEGKFDRIVDFGRALPRLRHRLRADLARPGFAREKVLAIVVALMLHTLARIGNHEYARSNRSYGLTTLRDRHFIGGSKGARLRFRGKGGQDHDIAIDDPVLARRVRACQELPGQALFQYRDDDGALQPVSSSDVNDYLRDTLGSAFTYYEYDVVAGGNACPDPALETLANRRTNYNFETGLDQMMKISDNRTTRGTVIRYGGFAPFNTTASTLGLSGTTMRHNIGCAYRNLSNGKYEPTTKRNDTTASNLARIYEGVWNSTLLSNTNSARTEFLESANPNTGGASSALQLIINNEAAKLGKSAIAAQFGDLVRTWGKGGSYGTCLPNSAGNCGQKVIVRSGTGLIRLPIKVNGAIQYRTYSFARLISDVPVPNWGDATDTAYSNAYANAANELYRDEIRAALLTW